MLNYPFVIPLTPWPWLPYLRLAPWLLLLLLWLFWLCYDLAARYFGLLLLPWLTLAIVLAWQRLQQQTGEVWIQSRQSQFFYKNNAMIPIKVLAESRFYGSFILLAFRLDDGQKLQCFIAKTHPDFCRWLLYFLHEMEE